MAEEVNAPISAEAAVAAGAELDQLRVDTRGLWWRESDPQTGRYALRHLPHGATDPTTMTPASHSVRSRVHEYGGGDWCLAGPLLCYIRAEDQQIYTLDPSTHAITALTRLPASRFNALTFDPTHQALIAVCETHADEDVTNTLVMVRLDSGAITTLHRGHDFYTMPAVSRDGHKLAFIAWDHPLQPWIRNTLQLCTRSADGRVTDSRALGGDESFVHPRFDQHGALLAVTDRSGWWNPHRYDATEDSWLNMLPVDADCAFAQWQCGPWVWDINEHDTLALCGMSLGEGRLFSKEANGEHRELSDDRYCLYREICILGDRVYLIAYARDNAPAIVSVEMESACFDVLYQLKSANIGHISVAESFCFPVEGTHAHGYFYPAVTSDSRPAPLVIFTHGGPTAATYPIFNPKIQFWTQHGFAVADINYRGSTGFGRAYRLSLAGRWGEADVADCVAAVDYLAEHGLCRSDEAFIRGSSAGGYTTLCALAFTDRFRGGASLYGVSDPLALIKATHKFESHYLQWLIGDPVLHHSRYQARTPLIHADQIHAPVIFFQGTEDPVVVPQQTADMVKALALNGVPVECVYFEGEAHGFRQAAHNARVLEEELAFYRHILQANKTDSTA